MNNPVKARPRLLLTIYLGSLFLGCAAVDVMTKTLREEEAIRIWRDEPARGDARAVVILLHGLNLKPARMDDWSKLLCGRGALVYRFGLYGHDPERESMGKVKAQMWRLQFKEIAARAEIEAKKRDVPIYLVGFSLGALVVLESMATGNVTLGPMAKMVLIAPAISIPWYAKAMIGLLSIFGDGFMLPSRSPKAYRANRGTSIAAYKALLELKGSLDSAGYKHLNADTLVLIDRYDELVKSRDIEELMIHHELTHWRMRLLDNRFAYDNYGFRHLMVDEESMGKELWAEVAEMVVGHLGL